MDGTTMFWTLPGTGVHASAAAARSGANMG
jgi:hypothetical protein